MTAPVLGPVEAEVVATRPDGGFQQVALAVPRLAEPDRARPGQFLVVPPAQGGAVVFPQTWWLCGVSGGSGHPATVQVVAPETGLAPGDRVRVTGPLGRGFALPSGPVPAVVVGHQLGQGPARWLAALLRARGGSSHLVLVAGDRDRHLDLVAARRLAASVVLTDPAGLATAVARVLTEHAAPVLYAVGPPGVVAAAAAAGERSGATTRVTAFDAAAGPWCGVGLCGSCTVRLRPGSGQGTHRTVRACVAGPALPGDLLEPVR